MEIKITKRKTSSFHVFDKVRTFQGKNKYRKPEADVRCKPYFIFLVHLQDKVKSVLTPSHCMENSFFLVMLSCYKNIFCFVNRYSYSSIYVQLQDFLEPFKQQRKTD